MSDQTPKPVRAFLDANVMLAAALNPDGGSSKLWSLNGVELVTCEQAYVEAWTNLGTERGRTKCEPVEARARLTTLMGSVEIIASQADRSSYIYCEWQLSDPDDEPLLMDAINCQCQFFLTSDSECFGPYYGQTTHGVTVLPPGKFLNQFVGPVKPISN